MIKGRRSFVVQFIRLVLVFSLVCASFFSTVLSHPFVFRLSSWDFLDQTHKASVTQNLFFITSMTFWQSSHDQYLAAGECRHVHVFKLFAVFGVES